MSCDNCYYCEPNERFGVCWFDPANPKEITQPEAKCEYEKEKSQ